MRYLARGENLPAASPIAERIRKGAKVLLTVPYDTYSRPSGYRGPVLARTYVPDYVATPLGILPAYYGEAGIGEVQPVLQKPHPSGMLPRRGWRLSLSDLLRG